MKRFEIRNADCREVMKSLPANSVDSIVTDPPYGLEFMGKGWDRGVPGVEFWTEAIRVLKPGGYLLAFGGTRTFHRLTVAIEDSGFEIRDCLGWIYGSGFPKSHNISKAIDKAAGAEAANWDGWGTALKPAWEPIILARKPLIGTVAENVLAFGTGGLNIDACRIETEGFPKSKFPKGDNYSAAGYEHGTKNIRLTETENLGRWPANILHDGSAEAIGIFPETKSGILKPSHFSKASEANCLNGSNQARHPRQEFGGDSGSAARFFYCPKASRADREEGLDAFDQIQRVNGNKWTDQDYRVSRGERPPSAESGPRRNFHPTVKPSALMGYLCRLVTRPGGTVLDPFAGSGSTGKAALSEGFRFIGAELDPAYAEIAEARCLAAAAKIPAEVPAEGEEAAQLDLFGEG